MSFSTTYTRTKTFANGGTLLPADLNNIQDDLGNQLAIANVAGGFNEGANVRRGKSIIATSEARTNVAYGLLTTPDRVQSIVLPTDGLIAVGYRALWRESVSGAARAALFLGVNQVKQLNDGSAPSVQEANNGGTVGLDTPLVGGQSGLLSGTSGGGSATFVTTGQILNLGITGPFTVIEAAAGTYDVSVQFKASSGTVTVQQRKLWVWSMSF